jgi:hypothetical protein
VLGQGRFQFIRWCLLLGWLSAALPVGVGLSQSEGELADPITIELIRRITPAWHCSDSRPEYHKRAMGTNGADRQPVCRGRQLGAGGSV